MNGFDMIAGGFKALPLLTTDTPESFVIAFTQETAVQVVMHMITVLALFYVLYRLLFNPIRNILEKRKQDIADEFKRIDEDTEAVAVLKSEYEGKLKNINAEADQILTHARKRAIEREDEIIKEAKGEANRLMKRAHLEIEREKELMQDEVRKEIIEVATVMASKFVAATISEELKTQLVEETMTGMDESTWQS